MLCTYRPQGVRLHSKHRSVLGGVQCITGCCCHPRVTLSQGLQLMNRCLDVADWLRQCQNEWTSFTGKHLHAQFPPLLHIREHGVLKPT